MYDPTNRMSGSAQVAPRRQWISALELQFADLLRTSGAEGLGLAREEFHQILVQIGEKYLPADAGVEDARVLYQTLRVADLALARACAAGQEKAWEVFLTRFREKLYDAGRAIAGDDSRGRELADSIYAELYGLSEREGVRASKLASYTGRGSLDGWLRTVLAQEFVNRYRTQKRLVSLEEKEEDGVSFEAPRQEQQVPVDARLNDALDEVFREMASEDCTILAAYYLDKRKLAEIGRMLGFHEATASRKLERITKRLRQALFDALVKRGMSHRQAEEALETDVRDLQVNVRDRLAQEKPAAPFNRETTPG
jgi:RNA polymerase sigma-70 factor (ECF subfamily)